MNAWNDRLSPWLQRQSDLRLGTLLWLAAEALNGGFAFLATLFPTLQTGDGPSLLAKATFLEQIFLAVVVAPLAETAVFQWLPAHWLRRRRGVSWRTTIFVAALVFGLSHFYSPGYIVWATLIGALLTYGFSLRYDNSVRRAFFLTAGVHAMFNMITVLTRLI